MGGDVDGWAARIHLGAHRESTEAQRGSNGILAKGVQGCNVTLRHSPQGNRVAALTGEANGGMIGNGRPEAGGGCCRALAGARCGLQFEETGRRREKIANCIAGMISSLVLIRQHRGHSQA